MLRSVDLALLLIDAAQFRDAEIGGDEHCRGELHRPPLIWCSRSHGQGRLEALLRLIRQRWSIENEWNWARDAQLGEDAHRYANRTGVAVFSFLCTIVM